MSKEKMIALKPNSQHITHLQVRIYYNLGGMNYFNYKMEPRGYYLSVTPVEYKIEGNIRSIGYAAFSGYKHLLKTVTRKSKKSESEAERIAQDYESTIIERILEEKDLELEAA